MHTSYESNHCLKVWSLIYCRYRHVILIKPFENCQFYHQTPYMWDCQYQPDVGLTAVTEGVRAADQVKLQSTPAWQTVGTSFTNTTICNTVQQCQPTWNTICVRRKIECSCLIESKWYKVRRQNKQYAMENKGVILYRLLEGESNVHD